MDITDIEQKKERRLKRNEGIRELWNNIKCNIRITGVPEGEERERKGQKKILKELIAKNFPNVRKEPLTQIQEAQQVPYKIHPKWNTPRHILIKLAKIKDQEKILKAAKGKKSK